MSRGHGHLHTFGPVGVTLARVGRYWPRAAKAWHEGHETWETRMVGQVGDVAGMSPVFHRLAAEEARHTVARGGAPAQLRSTVLFMQTGAHPDDETSGLLALLGRRHGVHLAYACATRGEGGQNVLGPERGDDLAMIRVREMELAAHALGCSQHWLSAGIGDAIRDWRFSKSAEETLAVWGRERTLERMVRIVRAARPDVLCPTFLDVGGQHGHHRAMTRIAFEAYHLAADARAFPQHLELGLKPWAVSKFYLPAWSGAGGSYDDDAPPPVATVQHDVGEIDAATGVPYVRIGEWSRRFHASQGMGEWQEAGSLPRPLHLAASRLGPGGCAEASVLDALPATLVDWAREEPRWRADLVSADSKLQAVVARPRDGDAIALASTALGELRARADAPTTPPGLAAGIERINAALILVRGLGRDCRDGGSDAETTAPRLAVDPSPRRVLAKRSRGQTTFPISIALSAQADIADEVISVAGATGLRCAAVSTGALKAGATAGAATSLIVDGATAPAHAHLPLAVAGEPAVSVRRAHYPHTGEVTRLCEAAIDVHVVDVAVAAGTRVAYAGAGLDNIDHWLGAIGIPVVAWTADLDLDGISTMVVGIQAFGARDDLVSAVPRLHAFVRGGGHLLTFYHRPQDRFADVPLAGLEIGSPSVRWRVTRADAPVTVLAPACALLTAPNRIGASDWDGWRKERGLYFASRWVDDYTPLLAMSDPGEPSLHGALVSGRFGNGRHTHCALALHSELDEAVPGAVRLLANLVQPA